MRWEEWIDGVDGVDGGEAAAGAGVGYDVIFCKPHNGDYHRHHHHEHPCAGVNGVATYLTLGVGR